MPTDILNDTSEDIQKQGVVEPLKDDNFIETQQWGPKNILNSPKLKAILATLHPTDHSMLIGFCLRYLSLVLENFQEDEFWSGVYEFLSEEKKGDPNLELNIEELPVFKRTILRILGLSAHDESVGAKIAVYSHLMRLKYSDGYVFHGFNGAFEETILMNGLKPCMRLWDQPELDQFHAVLQKYCSNPPTHLATNDFHKVYFDENPKGTYDYALGSPEWFVRMISPCNYVDSWDYKKSRSFFENQYLSRITEIDDKIFALQCFEKYWKIFRGINAKPKVLPVSRPAVYDEHFDPNNEIENDWIDRYIAKNGFDDVRNKSMDKVVSQHVNSMFSDVNISISHTILSCHLTVLELPSL